MRPRSRPAEFRASPWMHSATRSSRSSATAREAVAPSLSIGAVALEDVRHLLCVPGRATARRLDVQPLELGRDGTQRCMAAALSVSNHGQHAQQKRQHWPLTSPHQCLIPYIRVAKTEPAVCGSFRPPREAPAPWFATYSPFPFDAAGTGVACHRAQAAAQITLPSPSSSSIQRLPDRSPRPPSGKFSEIARRILADTVT